MISFQPHKTKSTSARCWVFWILPLAMIQAAGHCCVMCDHTYPWLLWPGPCPCPHLYLLTCHGPLHSALSPTGHPPLPGSCQVCPPMSFTHAFSLLEMLLSYFLIRSPLLTILAKAGSPSINLFLALPSQHCKSKLLLFIFVNLLFCPYPPCNYILHKYKDGICLSTAVSPAPSM